MQEVEEWLGEGFNPSLLGQLRGTVAKIQKTDGSWKIGRTHTERESALMPATRYYKICEV